MSYTEKFLEQLRHRNPHQPEFQQAVEEVLASVADLYNQRKDFQDAKVLERLTEPDRVIQFRVTWQADDESFQVNRAWRVQFSQALGPYKGGLRFHETVNQGVLKFLAFEQILKNSLTGLSMGGGKGGSDFDPKGKSDSEVMRFCQALMTELQRYIGPAIDVPAGDIGVGRREIGYLFGQYLRLEQAWAGALTGKGQDFGGSALRTEATGYGCIYFLEDLLEHNDLGLDGMKVAVSGSGNVALYAARKATQEGARVVTLSDSDGFIHIDSGLSEEQLEFARRLKEERRGRISEVADEYSDVEYHAGKRPWSVPCDVALPCATQNELDEDDASKLIENGVKVVCEGANMPTTPGAAKALRESEVLHAPGKAANAGGVAVSGLEMSQNTLRTSWTDERVDNELRSIMRSIHGLCIEHGEKGNGHVNYVDGANVAGFLKVAEALLAYGAT